MKISSPIPPSITIPIEQQSVSGGSKKPSGELIQALDLAVLQHHSEIKNNDTAKHIAGHLLDALDLAVSQSAEDVATLPADAQQTLGILKDYIATGNWPDKGQFSESSMMAQVMANLEEPEEWCDAQTDVGMDQVAGNEPISRMQKVLQFCARVTQNDFESTAARHGANIANVAMRNMISVGLPTFIRQATAYAIESALVNGNTSIAARTALGAIAGAFPLVLNVIGLAKDNYQGLATATSNVSRATTILLGVGALAAAGTTGALPAFASTLAAYNIVYCGLRDSAQAVLCLRDSGEGQALGAMVMSAVVTAPIQLAANQAMTNFASPSGSGTAVQAWPVQNDIGRAGINALAEIAVDLTATAITAHADRDTGPEMRTRLEVGMVSKEVALDTLLTLYATRASVTNNTVLLHTLLTQLVNESGLSGISPTLVEDGVAAIVVAAQYFPFVGSLQQNSGTHYLNGNMTMDSCFSQQRSEVQGIKDIEAGTSWRPLPRRD